MNSKMITIILTIGDPASGLPLQEGNLRETTELIENSRPAGATVLGRWDAGDRSRLWLLTVDDTQFADTLTQELRHRWNGNAPVTWRIAEMNDHVVTS